MRNTSQTVLTKRTVDGCAPSDKRYGVWDSQVPGFGLRIGTSGVKTFVVRYRADGGGRSAPRRYVTVGRYGAVTVERARKKAQQILAEATVGDDPAMKRNAKHDKLKMTGLIDL